MNRLFVVCRLVAIAGLLAASRIPAMAFTPDSTPSADAIMQKAVERAEVVRKHESAPASYLYTKHTLTEDLDTRGHVKDRKEKVYEVSFTDGLSYLKLLQLNGQRLSAAELKKQEEKESAERQRMTDGRLGAKGDQREDFLTPDLVAKYNYTISGHKLINGRDAYEIAFSPKAGLQVKKFTDRFANQIAGTVWIDTEDFEIARAELHLQGEVALWGGMIGALKHCRYTLERTRMSDGVWFSSLSHGIFEGRKLMEPMLIRTRSESSNFHHPALALQ